MTILTEYNPGDEVYFLNRRGNIEKTSIKSINVGKLDEVIYSLDNGLVTNNDVGDIFSSKGEAAEYWLQKQGINMTAEITSASINIIYDEGQNDE